MRCKSVEDLLGKRLFPLTSCDCLYYYELRTAAQLCYVQQFIGHALVPASWSAISKIAQVNCFKTMLATSILIISFNSCVGCG